MERVERKVNDRLERGRGETRREMEEYVTRIKVC